jgi:hypothetical protein
MAAMRAAVSVPAVGFGDLVVDLAIGAALFIVVVVVTAVLMVILQAVLPGGDAGAERLGDVRAVDDTEAEPAPPHAASGG